VQNARVPIPSPQFFRFNFARPQPALYRRPAGADKSNPAPAATRSPHKIAGVVEGHASPLRVPASKIFRAAEPMDEKWPSLRPPARPDHRSGRFKLAQTARYESGKKPHPRAKTNVPSSGLARGLGHRTRPDFWVDLRIEGRVHRPPPVPPRPPAIETKHRKAGPPPPPPSGGQKGSGFVAIRFSRPASAATDPDPGGPPPSPSNSLSLPRPRPLRAQIAQSGTPRSPPSLSYRREMRN